MAHTDINEVYDDLFEVRFKKLKFQTKLPHLYLKRISHKVLITKLGIEK